MNVLQNFCNGIVVLPDILTRMKLKNPFLIRGYAGAEYFCDRETETRKLISAFENDRDVTLIAPRRFGKTGLIHHTFSRLPEEYVSIYLDVLTSSLVHHNPFCAMPQLHQ